MVSRSRSNLVDFPKITLYLGRHYEVAAGVAITPTKYYFHGDTRVAMSRNGQVYYLHGDHLGSTSLTTDQNGAVVNNKRFRPYGLDHWSDGLSPTAFGFTNQRYEQSFGLYDYNARYYSPFLGRFISPDSLVPEPDSSSGFNRYRYARNNPLNYTDPSGHCAGVCLGIIALGVIVGMALAPADVLAPDDELAANHPPLEPGYDPVEFVSDYRNGNYVAGTVGLGLEFIPGNDIPGVKQFTRRAKHVTIEAIGDFGQKAKIVQPLRKYRSFGGNWERYAEAVSEGWWQGKLFTYQNPAGEIMGAMNLNYMPHETGALEILALEGLGGGAGISLFQQAIVESQRNFNGGIVLESTDEAYGWYIKLNPTKVEDGTFYWSPEDAAKLLE